MLIYDYTLRRNIGENKSREFRPGEIPTTLGSLVIIEGPNASGKSTLLNILALGLFGNKNRRVNPLLQDKLNGLLDLTHQNLIYNFKVDVGNNIILEGEKKAFNTAEFLLKETVEGKLKRTLSSETFERDYNFIYDIPNNPTERLKELLKELREEQNEIGNKVREFGYYLDKTIVSINNSRNLSRLGEVKKQLDDALTKKDALDKKIPEMQKFLDLFEKKAFTYYYCKYSNDGIELTNKKDELERYFKTVGSDTKKKVGQINKDKWQIDELKQGFTEKYEKITPLLKDIIPDLEKSRFKIWSNINPYCFESEDIDNLRIESTHYIELFSQETTKLERNPAFKDANMLEQLIRSLQGFEYTGLMIPKLQMTIQQFILMLKEENQKSSVLVQRYDSLMAMIKALKEIRVNGDDLQTAQSKYKEEKEKSQEQKTPIDYYEKNNQLKKITDQLTILANKCNDYYQKCISKGLSEKSLECPSYRLITKDLPQNDTIDKYLQLGEVQVIDNIVSMQKEIEDKRIELSGLNIVIPRYDRDYQELQRMKPHKLESHSNFISGLQPKTTVLTSRILSEYSNYLSVLMTDKTKASKYASNDVKYLRYYNEVSKYLGHRLGVFRHIDKMYKARLVDLISGKIVSDDNEEILLSDMGTGQTQSAYITSLLNPSANDSRKIIAMFDEIAMMDDSSLQPILNRMRELHAEGRLILGILVQRSNNTNIITIGN